MNDISLLTFEAMKAKPFSESSSRDSSSLTSGGERGTEDTVYDGDGDINPRGLCVDTGLSPIPHELCRLWNFAAGAKDTSPIPHLSSNDVRDCVDESAIPEEGRQGADDHSTETESAAFDDVASMVSEEGIWMKGHKNADLKELQPERSRSNTSECCKFHAAGE